MSRLTESIFRQLDIFMQEHGEEYENPEEAINAFMEAYNTSILKDGYYGEPTDWDRAMDQVELAMTAKTKKAALEHLQEALRIDPSNVDAKVGQLMHLSTTKEKIDRLEEIIQENYAYLQEVAKKEKKNFNKDYVGHFYGILETRSHISAMYLLANWYRLENMNELAIKTFQEILRLNPNDNLGARYQLMTMYMLNGNEKEMKFLMKNYKEEGLSMLFPYLLLHIMRKDEKKALSLYRKLQQENPGFTKLIMARGLKEEIMDEALFTGAFRPGTASELAQIIFNHDLEYLLQADSYIYRWLYENKNLK